MQSKFHIMILAFLALTLIACDSSEAPEQAQMEEVITVDMNDLYYGDTNDNVQNPPVWQVKNGSDVTLRMENMGTLEHNWSILKAGEEIPVTFVETEHGDKILFSTGNIAGGARNEISFSTPEPGEYDVICTIPGHASVMQGRLIVEG